ncbi:uncharacterized protein BO72DRAFT_492998 [Aspergillus fijiensis CBS 313.89]|uniref:Uncharacterized protein n=1 Tax=Aspergillus fijiensis CBS 313.89 TaxID=1448319 RepID=A0A8G1S235_9EURO|nr:uncharacterized protein BO72DRAFT_492998 [Aspergillus fijiensis CBS 313.89]RAK81021.1 hypothetical protein BO72DRAFT_492998 [Aspergillus fijiensis CBS 313.89]
MQLALAHGVDLLALGHEVPEDLFEEDEEAPVYKKRRLTQGQESHMSELKERLEIAKGAYKLLREQVDSALDAARAAEERVEVAKKAAGEGRDRVKRLYEGIRSICKEAEEAGQPHLEQTHTSHTTHPIHPAHTTFECGQQSLVVYQDQIQLIAHFLDDYLPPKTPDAVTYQSPVNWAETFSSFLEAQSPMVHRSLAALTLNHAANSRHDDTLTQRSRQQYELAVQQICALNELNQPTDLIRSGMILALYKSYTYPPAQNSACNIVRQLEAPTTVLGKQDVRRLRTVDFLRICIDGQITPAPSLDLLTVASSDVCDQLLDILFQITQTLSAVRRKTLSGRIDRYSADHLMRNAFFHEGRMLDWYRGLELENDGPPYVSRASVVAARASASGDSILAFPNPSIIPLVLLYWIGMVAVYASLAKMLQTLKQSGQFEASTTLPQRLKKAENLCHYFATRINQCHAGCAGLGLGTAILAAATSLAARQICPVR